MALARRGPAEVPVVGGRMPKLATSSNCPSCGVGLDSAALGEHAYVCRCGHHFRIHADAWIALVADRTSWQERWADIRPHDLLGWTLPKPYREAIDSAAEQGLNEAVRTGTCTLAGHPIWLAAFDFRFMGGSLSIVAGERLARGIEQATAAGIPYVMVAASGGARMQEGVLALMQMAKINGALARLHDAGVPYFAILTDPTFGGTSASLAFLADVVIAEPGSSIGFTGARVIRQATYADLPEGFQSAQFQLDHGQVDMIVARDQLRPLLAHLLELYR